MAGLGSHTPRDPYTSSLNVLTRRQNVFRPKQYPLEGCMEERIKEGVRTRLWVGEGTSLPHKSRAQKQAVQIALPLAHCTRRGRCITPITSSRDCGSRSSNRNRDHQQRCLRHLRQNHQNRQNEHPVWGKGDRACAISGIVGPQLESTTLFCAK